MKFAKSIFFLCFFTTLSLIGVGVKATEQEFDVVKNGKADKYYLSAGDKWEARGKFLEGGGANTRLGCKKIFSTDNFVVEAELVLCKVAKTAASFQINESHFGFDGRGKDGSQLFIEGADLTNVTEGLGTTPMKAGEKFQFSAICRNRILSFYINKKLIKRLKLNKDIKSFYFCFRPQRSRMHIYSFSIRGEAVGNIDADALLGIKQSSRLYRKFLATNSEALLKLGPAVSSINFESSNNSLASSDEQGNFKISVSLLRKAYQNAISGFLLRPVQLVLKKKNNTFEKLILYLYDPDKISDFSPVEVRKINNVPYVFINGKWQGMLEGVAANLPNSPSFSGESIKKFAGIGLNIFPTAVSPRHFMEEGKSFDSTAVVEKTEKFIEDIVRRIIAEAPQGKMILFWDLEMPVYWRKQYASELIKLENGSKTLSNTPGKKLQPSYASKTWRRQAGNILRQVLLKLRKSQVADRIAGVRVCYGNCGEWNHWGYHQRTFVDFSKPMQEAFGKWLKNKYKTEKMLRRAWQRNDISFASNNLVPSAKIRRGYSNSLLRKLPGAQPAVDYYQFFQYYTVSTIEYFAKIIKEASNNRLLAGAYYGYYLNHFGINYHFQDSGHYGLKYYLDSPFLDFLGGPYTYQERLENAQINGVFSSIAAHGKLWISEHDQRTHRSLGARNKSLGATANVEESIAVLKRDFMNNLSKGTSFYFYDFIKKWYNDEEYLKALSVLKKISKFRYLNNNRTTKAEVAVFMNEESVPYMSSSIHSGLRTLANMLMFEMDKAGAPWKMYLLSDLGKINLDQFKLIILPDSYFVSSKYRNLIKKRLCGGNRNIIWLYAPALLNNRGVIDPDYSMGITQVPIKFKEKFAVSNLIPQNLPGVYESLLTPNTYFMTYAGDSKGEVLGRFPGLKMAPGAVEKKLHDWTSYLICFPGLDREWLRALYKRCGVHVWNQVNYDIFHVSGNFVSLYSHHKGNKTITLPSKAEIIYDIFGNKIIARDSSKFTFKMPEKIDTQIIFFGSQKEFSRFKDCISGRVGF